MVSVKHNNNNNILFWTKLFQFDFDTVNTAMSSLHLNE